MIASFLGGHSENLPSPLPLCTQIKTAFEAPGPAIRDIGDLGASGRDTGALVNC